MWGKPTRFVRIFPASTRLHIGTRGHFSFSKKNAENGIFGITQLGAFTLKWRIFLRDLPQKQRISSIASGRAMWWWTDQSGSGKQLHTHTPLLEKILGRSYRPNTPSCTSFAPQVETHSTSSCVTSCSSVHTTNSQSLLTLAGSRVQTLYIL